MVNDVAQKLLDHITTLERRMEQDSHYYRGAREGILLLLQEMSKAANDGRPEGQSAEESSVSEIRQERKKAEAGAK